MKIRRSLLTLSMASVVLLPALSSQAETATQVVLGAPLVATVMPVRYFAIFDAQKVNGVSFVPKSMMVYPVSVAVAGDRFTFVGKNAPVVFGQVTGGKIVAGRPNGTVHIAGTKFADGRMGGAFRMIASDGHTYDGRFALVSERDMIDAGRVILGSGNQYLPGGSPVGGERGHVPGNGSSQAGPNDEASKKAQAAWQKNTDTGIPTEKQGKAGTDGVPRTSGDGKTTWDKACDYVAELVGYKETPPKDPKTPASAPGGDRPDLGSGGGGTNGANGGSVKGGAGAGGDRGPQAGDQGGGGGAGGTNGANGGTLNGGPNKGDNPFEVSGVDTINMNRIQDGSKDPVPAASKAFAASYAAGTLH